MRNVRIAGTEYLVQGPLPSGAFILTGPRGGELMARPFSNDPTRAQVIRVPRRSFNWTPLMDGYGRQVIVNVADLA